MRRPFLYFPLGHHFEQQYTSATASTATAPAGASTTPPRSICSPTRSPRDPPARCLSDVETDGAARAADLLAELL